MNLHGFLIARNEGDIIGPVLRSLLACGRYRHLHFFDNGSDDDTLAVAQTMAGGPLQVNVRLDPYSDALKYRLIAEHASSLREGDWVHVLDADEVLAGDPVAIAELADREGCNAVEHGCAQFYLTPDTADQAFDPAIPLLDQLQHYLINYGEPRLFRYTDLYTLSEAFVKGRDPRLRIATEHLPVMHFQSRSRTQIERRIQVRMANNQHSGNWGHVKAADWRQYLVPAKYLHCYDGQLRYGLPKGIDLFTVRNNAAYTAASLKWMRRNGHLGAEHERFFIAPLWERRLRSLNPAALFR